LWAVLEASTNTATVVQTENTAQEAWLWKCNQVLQYFALLLLLLLLLLLNAIQFSLGGSSSNTSIDKTNKNIHERNNTKTQYKQYKTHKIQVHTLPKHTHMHTTTYYKTS
jgi:uncharacterized membrane protein